MADNPSPSVSTRRVWAQACTRIAWIAGVFSLVLGGLLLVNSLHLYQGSGNGKVRLVEARELLPLKAALREDPKNEALKDQIRRIDQQARHDYFRREQLAARGGWLLLAGSAAFLAALKIAGHLKRPAVLVPNIPARREDPARTSALAARAVAGTTLALAGLGVALVWGTGRQWQGGLTELESLKPVASIDPAWFPSDEEIAKNWPRFRGPDGSGITNLANLPETWDGPSGRNVLWKSAVELPGENSPVVWGGFVFVTGATAKRREVYGYDAGTGSLLWKQAVAIPQSERAEPPEVLEDTGFAAPTAATDGRRVFAMFGNGDIAGFTTEGKRLWARNLGTPENMYGHATSLSLWHNRVIVVFDQADAKAGKSQIMALDSTTGETVWSTPRPVANSWVSPILIKHQDREQIITAADPWVIAYDPASGREIWKSECMEGDVAASPAYANGFVYVGCDKTFIAAIRPDASGTIDPGKFAWKHKKSGLPDMCSLLCDGPLLYTLVFGVLHAYDALTGEHLWQHDNDTGFQASPSLVNGRLFLLSEKGVMIIGEGGRNGFKETGRAELGEGAGASPAFATGRIYLRGKKHLFCIGTQNGK